MPPPSRARRANLLVGRIGARNDGSLAVFIGSEDGAVVEEEDEASQVSALRAVV